MRVIPAIDIIEGKCVRLTKGDYDTKKIYNENPLEVAKRFEDAGIEYLHVVDLDGAKASQIINYKTLENIASKTNLKIDFGGGIKSDEDIEIAFNSGAHQITGGSIAVKQPDIFKNWLDKYGTEKVILGADFYPNTNGGSIATNGWKEQSTLSLIPFIKAYQNDGVSYVICTDISKDGMLQGPSFDTYTEIILHANRIQLIASGGISSFEELPKLKDIGCEGVIIGKAIYENKISLAQLEQFIINS